MFDVMKKAEFIPTVKGIAMLLEERRIESGFKTFKISYIQIIHNSFFSLERAILCRLQRIHMVHWFCVSKIQIFQTLFHTPLAPQGIYARTFSCRILSRNNEPYNCPQGTRCALAYSLL